MLDFVTRSNKSDFSLELKKNVYFNVQRYSLTFHKIIRTYVEPLSFVLT